MHWNYRITRICRDEQPDTYQIREVYYDGDRATGWTNSPAAPFGESRQELLDDLTDMLLSATDWPVLDIPDPDALLP